MGIINLLCLVIKSDLLKVTPVLRLGFYVHFELQLLIGSSTQSASTSRSCLKMRDHLRGQGVLLA